jgi:ABC-type uncharacterized transport system YnjBCD permease subunit
MGQGCRCGLSGVLRLIIPWNLIRLLILSDMTPIRQTFNGQMLIMPDEDTNGQVNIVAINGESQSLLSVLVPLASSDIGSSRRQANVRR